MLIQIKNKTELFNDFLDDANRLVKQASSERQMVVDVSNRLTELLNKREQKWLPSYYLKPRNTTYSQYPLYIEPNGIFCVTAVTFAPGTLTAIHDHRVWGVVGVYQGYEEQVMYKHEGQKLVQTAKITSYEGECSYLLPPDEEIHSVFNPNEQCAVSLHVYGADIAQVPRRQFCLKTGQIKTVYSKYEK